MVFIDWPNVYCFCASFAALLISIKALGAAGRFRTAIRLSIQIITAPTIPLAGLLCALYFFQAGCGSYSPPIYSPSHFNAARLFDEDDGALGGSTAVAVYSHHGLTSDYVLTGDYGATNPTQLEWPTDTHLVIHYYAGGVFPVRCNDTRTVTVECIPNQ